MWYLDWKRWRCLLKERQMRVRRRNYWRQRINRYNWRSRDRIDLRVGIRWRWLVVIFRIWWGWWLVVKIRMLGLSLKVYWMRLFSLDLRNCRSILRMESMLRLWRAGMRISRESLLGLQLRWLHWYCSRAMKR
jgi:hypothetical protein